jgi:hypothetical protein
MELSKSLRELTIEKERGRKEEFKEFDVKKEMGGENGGWGAGWRGSTARF